ncbi:MAG TPA: cytochrome c3 family protein [Amaricoccus sp.]|nr:cytochrome c3 family protein [Amaricoccus sp.]
MLARAVLGAALAVAPAAAQEAVPGYVGSAACAGCHAEATAAWTGSHHALAWTEPSDDTVRGDFGDVSIEHGGATARFFRRDGGWFIEAEDGEGQRRAFEVVGVAGWTPLQQYLISPEPGRTQAFDVAWDVAARRWYPLWPDQPAPPGDGFHWTGPYKSWEARCAECHATGYSRNYRPGTRTYAPELAEIGVGCEACHGPGSAHVADPRGELTADLGASAEAEIGLCATCHARREAFGDGNPLPGTRFHDAYNLALLRPGLYEADGTIRDEDYEFGSFLQSRMYAQGVRCSNCHEPHAATLRAEGNAVCGQCHSPAGNPGFPSLRHAAYDSPAHHFHPPGSAGAQCPACHMPERTYMGIDTRRDHGFRVPRPDLAATGAPDACTDCHADRTAAWAADEIARRFPESSHRGPHFATAFAAAQWVPDEQVPALLAIAGGDAAGIVRATALELLPPVGGAAAAGVADLVGDRDPLVRAAAVGALRALPPAERWPLVAPALSDPLRAVRVAAARALLDATPAAGSPDAGTLAAAMREWRAALTARADFPETHLQIGGAALTVRDWRLAAEAFGEAASLDPQLVDAWVMLVRIRAGTGDIAGARAALDAAKAHNPHAPAMRDLAAEIGAPGP